MDVEVGASKFLALEDYCSTFRHVAEGKGLDFVRYRSVASGHHPHRRQAPAKVLKNLLSNALTFTEHGSVKTRERRPAKAAGCRPPVLYGHKWWSPLA